MLKVYQIYFESEHIQFLEREYKPYLNEDCSVFFESEVIRKLVSEGAHKNCEYFGVVSYKLRDKIAITKRDWSSIKNIANTSDKQFTAQDFELELMRAKPDIMSFQRHVGHDSISFADQFHPNFSKYFAEIMQKIGYKWTPKHFPNVFYCNYFVAKSEIYERFVTEMLAPAMKIMQEMPELMGNSKYPKQLPGNLKKKWGIDHYPYHAFLCERFMSYFAHENNLNCLHY